MKQSWRIRTYLVSLVLVIVIPVTGVLIYTIYANLQQALDDANQLALALAEITAINTGRYVDSRQSLLARIAERPQVQSLNPDNCDPILRDFQDFEAGFTNVVVLNKDGLVVCSAIPMSRPISYADGDNFRRARQTDAFVVGSPSYGRISKKWILPLAYPIHDHAGRFNGLIGAAIDLVNHEVLHGLDILPDGTRAALINSAGVIIAHTHEPHVLVGQKLTNNTLLDVMNKQQTGQQQLANMEGKEMLVGFSRAPGSDWFAVVGIPTDSILAQAFAKAHAQIALLLIILLVATSMAFVIARRIEKPISGLASTANAVAAGNVHTRVNTSGPHEITAVATEFNHMLDQRARAEQQLREKAEHLHLAMAAADMASWEWNIQHNRMYCTDDFWSQAGLDPEETAADFEYYLSAVHADDRPLVQQAIQNTVSEGLPYACEYRVIWPDGSVHWLAAHAQLIRDSADQPERVIGICMDITERMHSDQQMRYLASHDSLTGLYNRREFEQRLQLALNRLRHKPGEHAVLYLDLDQFKVVNDTCGHVAGDELLRQLASLLGQCIRDADTLARLGGDEFVVLLEDCPLGNARRIAEQLRQTVLDFHYTWQQHGFRVGVSIGLVPIDDVHDTLEQILSAADAACFVAKDQGRNRVHIHHAEDKALAQHHGQMEWIARIHSAFTETRFRLYAQLIEPISSGGRQHCEILVRMLGDDGRLIPPMAFIPAAERYGLMTKIDRWVIASTFNCLAETLSRQQFSTICNINLSATSLCDADLLPFIEDQFEKCAVPPAQICFEITETAAVSYLPQAMHFINTLKKHGCLIALDDFGSGMSSFSYLKNFTVDYLKIDGSFVLDVADDPVDRAMIDAINKIGHVMNIKTIAECVENRNILEQLHTLNIDYAQGHAIAMPVAFEDFIRTMSTESCQSSRRSL